MESSLAVDRFAAADRVAVTAFVADHPTATPFHTLAWRDAVATAFDYDPAYRTVRDERGDLVAVVPGFSCGGPVVTEVVNPFCEYGFPLVDPDADADVTAVLAALRKTAGPRRTLALKDADWTGVVGYNECGFGGVAAASVRRLSLDAPFAVLSEHVFDRKLGRNVRVAREAGVTVDRTDDVDAFYPLYLDAMRRRGSPQFPRAFVAALVSAFGDRCSLLVARLDGDPVAGLLALDHGGHRSLLLNGSDGDRLDVRPNDRVYWAAVRRACDRDLDVVDFGRSGPESGVDRFKAQFGATRDPLTTLVAPPRRALGGSVSTLRRLEPLAKRLAPVVTHPAVGPRLKEWIHE
ncbi:MAG: lipid II:glycine glycyltransferase FemX [Haloplanus sp.]